MALAIAATNANQNEGSAFTFTVTRTGITTGTSTVNFTVAGSGANPASAADFGGAFPSGIVTFGPGETSKVITIRAVSDNFTETDEGFVVVLSGASAESQIVTPSAQGTIREGCLTVGNLVVGDNVLTYTCGVPGTMVAFAMGRAPGSTTYAQYGVTLGLATPMIMGIGVTDANGVARIIVRLSAAQLLSPLYFQAFEASPTRKVSNVVIR